VATSTEVQTLKVVLDDANPQKIADALQQIKLGSILDVVTQTYAGSAVNALTLDDANPLAILSVSVTAAAVGRSGAYVEHDTATAPTSDNLVGTFTINAARTVITFPAGTDATAITVRYLKNVAKSLSDAFAQG